MTLRAWVGRPVNLESVLIASPSAPNETGLVSAIKHIAAALRVAEVRGKGFLANRLTDEGAYREAIELSLAALDTYCRANFAGRSFAVLDAPHQDQILSGLEKEFVRVAKAYSEKKRISYGAWRDAGVPAVVLKRAGIARTRG